MNTENEYLKIVIPIFITLVVLCVRRILKRKKKTQAHFYYEVIFFEFEPRLMVDKYGNILYVDRTGEYVWKGYQVTSIRILQECYPLKGKYNSDDIVFILTGHKIEHTE